ncbi:hypothetical protein SGUI_2822 [Serinicoccus hydrothermalis]|uniref:Uncharacterized protein n=1 Tax=Serinicoccus hydrothermalis TaxID=1758689 RepID=A0A1B1NFM3_9MICO|nr:hypothetical protein SGUI_2822 [Serinicoccus hydrothermalis]
MSVVSGQRTPVSRPGGRHSVDESTPLHARTGRFVTPRSPRSFVGVPG